MLNLVLMGPPGSGKGTQGALLSARYALQHLSTGDLFRAHLRAGDALGQKIRQYVENGHLVPDEIAIAVLEGAMALVDPTRKGTLLDGFPRTLTQAKLLDKSLAARRETLSLVLLLDVPEEELKKRIRERSGVQGRTDDQDEAKVIHRFRVYREETKPVSDYYSGWGKLQRVAGTGGVEAIAEHMVRLVEAFRARPQ